MWKVALLILAPGAEEMEAVITMNMLRRGGVKVTLAGLEGSGPVKCACDTLIVPDKSLEEALAEQSLYDAVVLPGGFKGSEAISNSTIAGEVLRRHEEGGKIVAAICAGPSVFAAHGIGKGKRVTSYPVVKDLILNSGGGYQYVEGERVVVDGNLVTSRVKVTLAGLEGSGPVKCACDTLIVPDKSLEEALAEQSLYDAVVLPGGFKVSEAISNSTIAGEVLRRHEEAGKIVAAICSGPSVFAAHGIGKGKRVTSYPVVKDLILNSGGGYQYVEGERVVVDGNLVTSRSPGTSFHYGIKLVEMLISKEKAAELEKRMMLMGL